MMTLALSLEAFDADPLDDGPLPAAVQQAFDDGYAQGLETAQTAQAALSAEFVQCVADLEFSYSEARSEILLAIAPLMKTVADVLLPHCAAAGFTQELALILEKVITCGVSERMTVLVHPDRYTQISTALSGPSAGVTVAADHDLSLNAAWIKHEVTEAHLDLDQLQSEITETLHGLETAMPRKETHG